MKKKFIFLMLIFSILCIGGGEINSLNAQETVTIGSGTEVQAFIPLNTNYDNTISEQIFLAEDFQGKTGSITSYAFKSAKDLQSYSTPITVTRNFKIYMINTDKASFVNATDWVNMTNADLVFNGEVTVQPKDTWTTITFDTPFNYETGKNVILCIHAEGTWNSAVGSFYKHNTTDVRSLVYYNDGEVFDATNITQTSKFDDLNHVIQSQFTFAASGEEPEEPTAHFTVEIGADKNPDYSQNFYLPVYDYAYHTISQQIYLKDEIGQEECMINSVSFKIGSGLADTRQYEVYLKNTDQSTFNNSNYIAMAASDKVFDGSVYVGTAETWYTINFTTPFTYTGNNIVICVYDKTGRRANGYHQFYKYSATGRSLYSQNDNNAYNVTSLTTGSSRAYVNQIKFDAEPLTPSVKITPESIDLGIVRTDANFFTEKPFDYSNYAVTVKAQGGAIIETNTIQQEGDFFKIVEVSPIPTDGGYYYHISYNQNGTAGEKEGTLVVTYKDSESATGTKTATIPLSAVAYAATKGEAIENPIEVAFTDNAYTHTATGMHDDYILPGEENDGNNGDAVYKFELAKESLITANVEGTNPIVAIYNSDFGGEGGPSSDNNNEGIQPEPSAPTTFGPYTFDSADELSNNFVNNGSGWNFYSHPEYGFEGDIYIQSGADWMLTKEKYFITSTSKLLFVLGAVNGLEIAVCVSENSDGSNLEELQTTYGSNGTYEADLSTFKNRSVYIGFKVKKLGYGGLLDDLALTDGSAKSRAGENQIDGVPYPAGTYYLVAAADGDFRLNLSISDLTAPAEFALTAPENNATEQNNPILAWEAAKYALSYNVYIGTSSELSDVEPVEVTTNSYQTENLSNNTKYYWTVEAVNEQGTTPTTSKVWSFVTPLNKPTAVAASKTNLYPGDETTISWTGVEGDDVTYNVYVDGVKHNTEAVEGTSYTLSGLDYNVTPGHNITVTANHTLGESAKSDAVVVKMTGYNDITGTITNGAGATLTFTGTDEFGAAQTFTTIVGDDDKYTMENVLAGTYTVTASKFDYQDLSEELDVICGADPITFDSEMTANPAADASLLSNVAVTEVGENAQITWTGAFNDTQKYDIYRKNVETGVVELVAENQNNTTQISKSYIDEDYAELEDGTYQYGVTTDIKSGDEELLKEIFTQHPVTYSGWDQTYNNYSHYWQFVDKVFYYYNANYNYKYIYAYSGKSAFLVNSNYNTSPSSECTLVTKTLDLTGVSSPSLNFYYNNVSYKNLSNSIYVEVQVDGESTWSELKILSGTTNGWVNSGNIDLKSYSNKQIKIRFRSAVNYSSVIGIDDVIVSEPIYSESATVWSNEIKKGGIVFTNGAGDGEWETPGNWKNGNAPTLNNGTEEVTIKASATISSNVNVKYLAISGGALTINSGATLTVTGELVNNDEYGLTINDGAQVFHNSENVKARFAMDIVAPKTWSSENTDGWQFIAAPFVNNTAPIANFTSPNYSTIVYDLYKYNGVVDGEEWDNQKDNPTTWGYYFENGVGYLASYAEARTAYLSGTLNNATSFTKELSYNEGKDLANFHLLGNPFTFDMDMTQATFNNLVNGVAIVNNEGGYTYDVTTIPVGDGFFVKATKATEENPSFSYNAASKATRGEKANSLNVIATSNAGNDNVVINLAGEQEGFPKMRNFNDAIATVYVQDKGANYGIYNCDENTTEVELNFNANQMGNYTISIEPNGKFQTVTLVDRFTGIETNMLLEDYSFTAMSEENNNRFILKLAVSDQQSAVSDNFVYQSGEELIVEAEGTVQIIDVMGRVVYNNDVTSDNNRINVSDFNNGAYVVRVINESEIKVEKVVIY